MRAIPAIAAALALFASALSASAAEPGAKHGLSLFGDLKYGPDFKHFAYVNPSAPKGGTLAIQIKQATGNQNFDTFNTLNIFVLSASNVQITSSGVIGLPSWKRASFRML